MLHPVGNLPPAVYWRRRIYLLILPAVLVLAVLWALFSGGGGGGGGGTSNRAAAGASSSASGSTEAARATLPSTPAVTSNLPSTSRSSPSSRTSVSAPSARSKSASSTASTASTARICSRADLRVEAGTSSASFAARSGPTFYLQVTNISKHACSHDLGDKQVQLVVRSGDVRIWGSHDCKVQPGTDVVSLVPTTPVRRGIVWSGRTSVPGCAGTRLYPQPGTYQLYATLSGQSGPPVTFTITA